MQIFKDAHDLCPVELRLLQTESLGGSVISEKIPSSQQLRQEVDVAIILQETIIVHLQDYVEDLR